MPKELVFIDHNQLYLRSKVPPLTVRRSNARLNHLFKIVNDLCDFPDAPVQQREIVYNNRQANSMQLTHIQVRSNQFKNSFSPGPFLLELSPFVSPLILLSYVHLIRRPSIFLVIISFKFLISLFILML